MARGSIRLLLVSSLAIAQLVHLPAPASGADPGSWRTWHIDDAAAYRLAAPPALDSRRTQRELKELLTLQRARTPKQLRIIEKWHGAAATVQWTRVMLRMLVDHRPRPPFAARALAVFHTGLYDAMVAAFESRAAFSGSTRAKPAAADARIDPLLGGRRGSSYASPEAAIAGAAERLLTHLFSNQGAAYFEGLADQAVESRLWAGANYRSDVMRARRLGREVATDVIERVKTDGSTNTGFAHPRREGEEYWTPTPPGYAYPPFGGAVGTWRPWLMTSPGQLRDSIPPPPAYGSPVFMDELREVIEVQANVTPMQEESAYFWADGPGTFTPAGHWNDLLLQLVGQADLDTKRTARAFALLNAATADAAIAVWEAKYYHWSIRPVTAIWRLCDGGTTLCSESEAQSSPERAPYYDSWLPLLETPSFPAYPSGHAGFSGAAASVITFLFPEVEELYRDLSSEAAMSRLWGGIHFRSDNDQGLELGRNVGQLAIEWAQSDGSGL